MARGEITTPESYKKWVLNLVDDLRAPSKTGTEIVVKDGEQKKREYEDARKRAAKTGDPKDLEDAKRLKAIIEILDAVVKARDLTTKAQDLYENIDANRKKLDALKGLDEGNSDEAKKIQRQLERARGGLQEIEAQRDAYGPNPKAKAGQKPVVKTKVEETPVVKKPTPVKPTTGTTGTGGSKGSGTAGGTTPAKPETPVEEPVTEEDKQSTASGKLAELGLQVSKNLFENVPGLKAIYEEYIDPKSGMTDNEFIKRIRQEPWYLKNSKEIKTRFINYYNYLDMRETGQADGSTDFEKQLQRLETKLQKRAVEMGSALASDPNAISQLAEKLYLSNDSEDDNVITQRLAAAIRPVAGMIGGKGTEGYSGQALQNYKALLQTARNNGFQLSDILPGAQTEQQVLTAIASGDIDINRVAQDARKLAAQGQPQYVRDLLSQGYDLAQVFAPYRQTMANILEIGDPNEIDLNDPVLRTAITDKGDMNLYDFKKALRQDKRWQYTEQAKEDVSNAALGVLRDFGFQG